MLRSAAQAFYAEHLAVDLLQKGIACRVEGEAVAHALGQAAVGLALPVGLIGRSGVNDIAVSVVVDRGRLLGNGHIVGEYLLYDLIDDLVELFVAYLLFDEGEFHRDR